MRGGEPVLALGLIEGKTPVGALTGMVEAGEDDVFTVRSVYVAPEYRRRMGGMLLINALQEILESAGVGLAIYTYVEGGEDTEMLPDFLEAVGASEVKGLDYLYSGPLGALFESPLFSEDFNSSYIKSAAQFTKEKQRAFADMMRQMHDQGNEAWIDAYIPEPELSFVRIENGQLTGYLTAGFTGDEGDELLIYISPTANMNTVGSLLSAFVSACRERISAGVGADQAGTGKISPETVMILPSPDDRYEQVFDRIEEIRDIQHTYIF